MMQGCKRLHNYRLLHFQVRGRPNLKLSKHRVFWGFISITLFQRVSAFKTAFQWCDILLLDQQPFIDDGLCSLSISGIFILVKKGRSYHALRIRIQLNFILVGRVNLRKQHLSNPSLKTERTCSLPTWHIGEFTKKRKVIKVEPVKGVELFVYECLKLCLTRNNRL